MCNSVAADSQLEMPGAKKLCTMDDGVHVASNGGDTAAQPSSEQMTSKDYYFDSYSHFGRFKVHGITR